MKKGALLVNTSRGSVVDCDALSAAIMSAQIFAAGLDVFETEPADKGNPLLAMDNVVFTAHNAGTTFDTWCRRAEFSYRNMQRVLEGRLPQAIAQEY